MGTLEILASIAAAAFALASMGALYNLARTPRKPRHRQTLAAHTAWGFSPKQWARLSADNQAHYNKATR